MYRPSQRAPKGKWGAFLHQMRRDRDWSQQQAFEALHEGLKLGPKSRASYVALDMGDRPPKPHEEEYLVSVFGHPPDVAPPSGEAGLAEAVNRQAAAIEALVAILAVREGVSPSDLPLAVAEVAARLLGDRDAKLEEAGLRRAGGA